MKRSYRGLGIYVFIILIIFLLWRNFDTSNLSAETYTYAQFEQAVEQEQVESIVIRQNKEVPTGTLVVSLEDGSRRQITVSDVGEVQEYLAEEGFTNYTLRDVPRENMLLSILPSLLMIVAIVVLFMMMTGQAGGGDNNKMMKFSSFN